jgi:hypothetical protein
LGSFSRTTTTTKKYIENEERKKQHEEKKPYCGKKIVHCNDKISYGINKQKR